MSPNTLLNENNQELNEQSDQESTTSESFDEFKELNQKSDAQENDQELEKKSDQATSTNDLQEKSDKSSSTNSQELEKKSAKSLSTEPAELTLNLGWRLREDVLSALIKLLSILNGRKIEANDQKELINTNNHLIQRLSILSFEDDEKEIRKSLKSIDENLLEDLDANECGPSFELNCEMRRDIIDILVRTFNFVVLSSKLGDDNKNVLIKETNGLINLLICLKPKLNDNETKDEESIPEDDLAINQTNDQLTNLQAKINELELKVKQLSGDDVTFSFEIKNPIDLLSDGKVVDSESFSCASFLWCLQVQKYKKDEKEYLGLFLCIKGPATDEIDWSVKADYELKLRNYDDDTLNISRTFKEKPFEKLGKGLGSRSFICMDDLKYYIKDDKIELGIHLTAEKVMKLKVSDDA